MSSRLISAVAACAGVGLLLAAPVAAQQYATSVEAFLQGPHQSGGPVSLVRSNPLSTLGAPDGPTEGTYFSLGFGGQITLGFGTEFSESVTIWETTVGTIANHPESADVYVGFGQSAATAQYWLVTSDLSNILAPAPISLAGANALSGRSTYNFVRIIDTSNPALLPGNADGFDVDAVSVLPIPAPASLALVGVAALVGVRRRR